MAALRIAFRVGDRRLLARVTHLWDRTDVSHCEVSVSRTQAGADLCLSASWLDGGVRCKAIALDPAKWRIYELPTAFSEARARAWFAVHAGQGYDWLGLFGFLFRPLKGFRRRQFCSEACAAMLGVDEPWRFTPRQLECLAAAIGQRLETA